MTVSVYFIEITPDGNHSTIKKFKVYDDSDRLTLPRVGDFVSFKYSGKGELEVIKILYDYEEICSSYISPEKINVYLKKAQKHDIENT